MGKAMIFSLPFYSHVKPTLPLVTELLARGEEVVYYSDEAQRELLHGYGVEFRSYGETQGLFLDNDPGIYLSNTSLMLEHLVSGVIGKSKTVLNAILSEVLADPPDYILRDCDAFWGRTIGELLDLPVACYSPTFAISRDLFEKDPMFMIRNVFKIKDGESKQPPSVQELDREAAEIAMRHQVRGFGLVDAFSGNEPLTLVFTSKEFQPHADALDERFVFMGPPFPAEMTESCLRLEKREREGQPLIYISFGSIYTDRPEFYRTCLEAFKDAEARIILSVGKNVDLSLIGEPPAHITVRRFVPQLEILREADLFISHGGYNSVCEALLFGVPMILIPQGADQFAIADRLDELEAGVYIREPELSPERLKEIAWRTLNDIRIRTRARELGLTFSGSGGAAKGVDALFEYVGSF
ncbi:MULTISPECIES: macrolide family glycosyltransferase [unclassified Paenibacillus]|uniref:macrolide family glycosyltransferase n=1 Tax=unclassified Paenibacillus TaxID=185978 RepID=UPI00095419DD|nr:MULTISPECIES: macrolide family glycosyltransferase [unclassified Paenibacillus]ASS65414.2 hypothetical protein CIC07_04205 [Paenibacillus sp. RUD330]SIQ37057.1 glycosyltransferase, MGT family [Paenibacillus sp. RU4X]SIQ59150.1 glycosyltransferase, MGT family [Paenibacillus sp. RU4T]